MSGEENLQILLSSMQPVLQDGVFVFCALHPGQTLPGDIELQGVFQEAEGKTLFLRKEEALRAGLPYAFESRMITLNIHSALSAVGFLSEITRRLAAARISVNAVSGFYHDHLFVPVDRAEEALNLLTARQAA
jgi:hypothetical protein